MSKAQIHQRVTDRSDLGGLYYIHFALDKQKEETT